MLVRSQFAIEFDLPQTLAMAGLLRLHPAQRPHRFQLEPFPAANTLIERSMPHGPRVDGSGERCHRRGDYHELRCS